MRRAAKRDLSEPDIVSALEGVGAIVIKISDADLPDLLVHYRDSYHLLECKTGNAKLRPNQAALWEFWAKQGVNIHVVRTPDEALKAIGFTWTKRKKEHA